jgi:hypothetical protein
MPTILVATLNIRNIADRWPERLSLLLADMAALQPDVMGLQEVVFAVQQDRLLGAAGEARYVTYRGWAGRPEYGNAILARVGGTADVPPDEAGSGPDASAGTAERLDLEHNRSALFRRSGSPSPTSTTRSRTRMSARSKRSGCWRGSTPGPSRWPGSSSGTSMPSRPSRRTGG